MDSLETSNVTERGIKAEKVTGQVTLNMKQREASFVPEKELEDKRNLGLV